MFLRSCSGYITVDLSNGSGSPPICDSRRAASKLYRELTHVSPPSCASLLQLAAVRTCDGQRISGRSLRVASVLDTRIPGAVDPVLDCSESHEKDEHDEKGCADPARTGIPDLCRMCDDRWRH